MKLVSFWNVDKKQDLEEAFYLVAATEERALSMVQEIADREKRPYFCEICDVEEWRSELYGGGVYKYTLEWDVDPHPGHKVIPNVR